MEQNNKPACVADAETNKRILALVKPEYMKRIPFFIRKHATEETCKRIAKEHPDVYELAKREETFTIEAQEQMANIINGIFEQKMKKHNM